MGKRDTSIISGFLSTTTQTQKEPEEQPKEQKTKEKTRRRKLKGFYITKENELRLKKLQLFFLQKGERVDESHLINLAIERLYLNYEVSTM